MFYFSLHKEMTPIFFLFDGAGNVPGKWAAWERKSDTTDADQATAEPKPRTADTGP